MKLSLIQCCGFKMLRNNTVSD